MAPAVLSVREMQEKDTELIADYFLNASGDFLVKMGVDIAKVPPKNEWIQFLSEQLCQEYADKTSYCIIWQLDDRPIGHSNLNKIIFGQEAYMHLHLWDGKRRKKGTGNAFVKMTLPHYFKNLRLQTLFCEPNALNAAPNKTLEKTGFRFIKTKIATPGWLNFEQPVNQWELNREDFEKMEIDYDLKGM